MEQLVSNRYEIRDTIGRGGMGEVYYAWDTEADVPVAIKQLRSEVMELNPQLLQRFIREGEVLRKLNHPNIVAMREAIEENGRYYIVMEYVEGGSLSDVLAEHKQLPIDTTMAIALEVADALTRAHHLKVIHRDIKPGNILLATDGTPRLTDFGVAFMEDQQNMTETGAMIGTFAYLSPEACRTEPLDERTDIWSFGVVLYEMLTGSNPFAAGQPAGTITAIINTIQPDIQEVRPDVSPGLANLINHMLQKEREERIPSVRMVGAELEAIIRGLDTPVRVAIEQKAPPPAEGEPARFATPPGTGELVPLVEEGMRILKEEVDMELIKANLKEKIRVLVGDVMEPDGSVNIPRARERVAAFRASHMKDFKLDSLIVTEDDGISKKMKVGPIEIIDRGDGHRKVNIPGWSGQPHHETTKTSTMSGGLPMLLVLLLFVVPCFACIGCMSLMNAIF